MSECKEVKDCHKRHPKVCKRLLAQKVCKFGKDCAYEHLQSEQKDNANTKDIMVHEIENMKEEIYYLKEIMQEFSKSVITLKEEMIHLNLYLCPLTKSLKTILLADFVLNIEE